MLYYNDKPVALQLPLKSLARSQEEQLKLPSLLEPDKLGKRHAYPWIYVGLLTEFPHITQQEVKRAFRKCSKDELLEAVYSSLEVDRNSEDSLKRLSIFMEEVQ